MHHPEDLPSGVAIWPLVAHDDDRGTFTELFREEWGTGVRPVQWNAVHSRPGILRGVHCHLRHADLLTVVAGRMRLGLSDLRPGSPTAGLACVLDVDAADPRLVAIPPGVAHGFFFPVASTHIYAVDHVWDPADELGCRWDDPGLGLAWGDVRVTGLSARDAGLGALDELVARLAAAG